MKSVCQEWKPALLEAALGQTMEKRLAEHIETCPACSKEWRLLQARAKQLEMLLPMVAQGAEPSPGFRARVLAAAGGAKKTSGRLRSLVLAGAAAAVILLLAVRLWTGDATKRLSQEELAAAQKLAEWRAPSDGLLVTPGQEILRTVPKLGRSYLDVPPRGNREE